MYINHRQWCHKKIRLTKPADTRENIHKSTHDPNGSKVNLTIKNSAKVIYLLMSAKNILACVSSFVDNILIPPRSQSLSERKALTMVVGEKRTRILKENNDEKTIL